MNESKKNKELIQRMAETLRNHTEPYKEGAWERFSAKYGIPKKRGMVQWPYWGAAALLLMAMGLFLFDRQTDELDVVQHDIVQPTGELRRTEEQPTAEIADKPQDPVELAAPRQTTQSREQLAGAKSIEAEVPTYARGRQDTFLPVSGQILASNARVVEDSKDPEEANSKEELMTARVDHDTVSNDAKLLADGGIEQFPGNESFGKDMLDNEYPEKATEARRDFKKWDLGLVVSPSLTNEKVNMGGGIAIAYRLSDKFSLSSGVSVGQLGLGQNPNYEPMANSDMQAAPIYGSENQGFVSEASSNRKEVTSVTSNLLALDIPIDLRYNITEGFYTSVGISFLTVLNEQRTNHLVDRGINQPTFEKSGSNKDLESAVQATYSSERTAYQPLEGKGYTGFVNFSVGRKVPLFRKFSLSIEPYFKLPIGSLSREEMDFTNGGIRIITGF
ncbi:hypothetical protein [Parapedobacter tibetensis]|uniref:hypothetical protein n=1 Tax=Parapedobacter tibetensis TaxID=2972951 RepID=UPI00214D92A1|nr:hypothetical protein [Parapedobacter tibetensis]